MVGLAAGQLLVPLQREECLEHAHKNADDGEHRSDHFVVVVNKRVHLDPHPPLELAVLDLLHDVEVEGAATYALYKALKEGNVSSANQGLCANLCKPTKQSFKKF